jgi:hypothetical protein
MLLLLNGNLILPSRKEVFKDSLNKFNKRLSTTHRSISVPFIKYKDLNLLPRLDNY